MKNILVSGGAGFIGSNFIRYLFEKTDFDGRVVNFDKLTYAGNPLNIADIARQHEGSRYFFVKGDICDATAAADTFGRYEIDTVVHLAAESHVDRSIADGSEFVRTNVVGTFTLLSVAREAWRDRSGVHFHHVSTDEVFGSLAEEGKFTEATAYDPHSPYSASKASSDHFVRAFHDTYGLPVTVSNCSNNYGPYQFPEKLIPLMILNLFERKPLPVYGQGTNVRDWLHVEDHAEAIWRILQAGANGGTYNVGGRNEWRNIDIVKMLCASVASRGGLPGAGGAGELEKLIQYVPDRPGHDFRYAIDCSLIERELGWTPSRTFEQGIAESVDWYANHAEWVQSVRTGEYRKWIEKNYAGRG